MTVNDFAAENPGRPREHLGGLELLETPAHTPSVRSRPRHGLAFLVSALMAACGTSAPSIDCSDPPTFTRDIEPEIVATTCIQCHSTERFAEARQGAPVELNFNSYALVAEDRVAFLSAITSGRMPPPDLNPPIETTKAQRDMAEAWAQCDFPE